MVLEVQWRRGPAGSGSFLASWWAIRLRFGGLEFKSPSNSMVLKLFDESQLKKRKLL